jgi:hypothetical protein
MKIKTLFLLSMSSVFLYQSPCFAETKYSIEYASSSPIKEVSLKDAEMSIELFSSEKPKGFINVRTDSNQSFTLTQEQDFEIVSIKGEEKYNARCSGPGTSTNTKIQITCISKNSN